MTDKVYAPTLTAHEHELIVGALDLASRHYGSQLQQAGLAGAEDCAMKLIELRRLAEKLTSSERETAKEAA